LLPKYSMTEVPSFPPHDRLAITYVNDIRFDWTLAIGTPQCDHRRDFALNAGFYTDADTRRAPVRFVRNASDNGGRGRSNPQDRRTDTASRLV
jgi:hypothetical protein